MSNDDFYRDLAREVNQTLGRKAISGRDIRKAVEQAKYIRRTRGLMGLWAYASELPNRFFTPDEIERLKRSSKWRQFSGKMIDLLVLEGVITPAEAGMLRRQL